VLICSRWGKLDPTDRRKLVDSELADSYTIRTIQAIRALDGSSSHMVPITAEIRLERNRAEAEVAGAPRIEIVAPELQVAANGYTATAPPPNSTVPPPAMPSAGDAAH
jgi:hypothetical protein